MRRQTRLTFAERGFTPIRTVVAPEPGLLAEIRAQDPAAAHLHRERERLARMVANAVPASTVRVGDRYRLTWSGTPYQVTRIDEQLLGVWMQAVAFDYATLGANRFASWNALKSVYEKIGD